MRENITQKEYDEIEELINKAVSARTKADAQMYVDRLDSLVADLYGSANLIMSQLRSAAKSATGMVANKESKVYFCEMELSKLHKYIDR